MPSRSPHPCAAHGCPALVKGVRFCARHAATDTSASVLYDRTRRKDDPVLALTARIHGSGQWRKVERLHKAQHPLCCDPIGLHPDRPTPTQQSHHIQPLSTHPELAFDMDNLAPLCTRCHAAIEARERQGEATQALFAAFPKMGNIS